MQLKKSIACLSVSNVARCYHAAILTAMTLWFDTFKEVALWLAEQVGIDSVVSDWICFNKHENGSQEVALKI